MLSIFLYLRCSFSGYVYMTGFLISFRSLFRYHLLKEAFLRVTGIYYSLLCKFGHSTKDESPHQYHHLISKYNRRDFAGCLAEI